MTVIRANNLHHDEISGDQVNMFEFHGHDELCDMCEKPIRENKELAWLWRGGRLLLILHGRCFEAWGSGFVRDLERLKRGHTNREELCR